MNNIPQLLRCIVHLPNNNHARINILVDVNDFSTFYINLSFSTQDRMKILSRMHQCFSRDFKFAYKFPWIDYSIIASNTICIYEIDSFSQWLRVLQYFNRARHEINLKRFKQLLSPDFDIIKFI